MTRYLRGTTYDGTCLLHKTTKVTCIHKHSGGYTHTHTHTQTHTHMYIYTGIIMRISMCVNICSICTIYHLCTHNNDTHNNTHIIKMVYKNFFFCLFVPRNMYATRFLDSEEEEEEEELFVFIGYCRGTQGASC